MSTVPAPARSEQPSARPRWPYAGAGQAHLLLGSVLVVVGSFLPWVELALGPALRGIQGAGLWTFYVGPLGIAGALVRRRGVALAHAVVVAAVAVGLPAWQLARLSSLGGFMSAWAPGVGLGLVLSGGILAARGAWRLRR